MLNAGARALELRRLKLGERLLRCHHLELHVFVERFQLAAADLELLFLQGGKNGTQKEQKNIANKYRVTRAVAEKVLLTLWLEVNIINWDAGQIL